MASWPVATLRPAGPAQYLVLFPTGDVDAIAVHRWVGLAVVLLRVPVGSAVTWSTGSPVAAYCGRSAASG